MNSSGTYVEGLTCIAVSSWDEMSQLLTYGGSERTVAATNANDWSSRSHAVFTLTLRQVREQYRVPLSRVPRRVSAAFERVIRCFLSASSTKDRIPAVLSFVATWWLFPRLPLCCRIGLLSSRRYPVLPESVYRSHPAHGGRCGPWSQETC